MVTSSAAIMAVEDPGIVGTLVASFLRTVAFMGETGFSYDGYPIILLILCGLNAFGYIVGALFFGRYLRRSEAITVPEYFGQRFNSRTVQVICGGSCRGNFK